MKKSLFWSITAKGFQALAAVSLVSVLVLSLMSTPAHGQLNVAIGTQLNQAAGPAYSTGSGKDLPSIIGNYIKVFLGFLGVIAIVLIIYAGFLWMTAGGNDDKVGEAKTIIKNAVVGLIIITLAYAITTFILGSILNAAK